MTCHQLRGQGDGQLTPRLAGLPRGYLGKQLQDYADGRRAHPQMEAIARALRPQDRQAVSAYYANLAWSPTAEASSDALGAELYRRGRPEAGLPACSGCHGPLAEGLGAANPPLAGQPAAYLTAQLDQWRAGRRRNDPQGSMLDISRRLTPVEAAAVSKYAASLRPAGEQPGAVRSPDRAAFP